MYTLQSTCITDCSQVVCELSFRVGAGWWWVAFLGVAAGPREVCTLRNRYGRRAPDVVTWASSQKERRLWREFHIKWQCKWESRIIKSLYGSSVHMCLCIHTCMYVQPRVFARRRWRNCIGQVLVFCQESVSPSLICYLGPAFKLLLYFKSVKVTFEFHWVFVSRPFRQFFMHLRSKLEYICIITIELKLSSTIFH